MSVADVLIEARDEIGRVDPARECAELLIGVAHQSRDRATWGGDRALTYWDRLPDKVRGGTYSSRSLDGWWMSMTRALGCGQPRDPDDRAALALALACGDDQAVLGAMRSSAEALCLRVRVAFHRHRNQATETGTEGTL